MSQPGGRSATNGVRGRGAAARRPSVPGRGRLLGAVAMVIFGSFMPWVDTAVGAVSGARGAGLWTFYAAFLGLGAALVPATLRWLRLPSAVVFAATAIALPVWQVLHVYRLVGFEGWRPGPGVVLVLGGGVLAAAAVRQMLRPPQD